MTTEPETFKVSGAIYKAPWEKPAAVPRWKNRGPRHMAEMFADDQERLNTLVAELNATRPGKHRQKDAIRYLLDFREDALAALEDAREVAP